MKKSILLLFCCFALSYCCLAQDCELLFNSAKGLYDKGDYENALTRFNNLIEKCGEGGDYRGAAALIEDCKAKLEAQNTQSLKVYPYKLSFNAQGGTETVKVTSSSTWMYGNCPNWIKLTKTSQTKLTVECEYNNSGKERKADITIVSEDNTVRKKIRVTQANSWINVSPSSVELAGYNGASSQITVICNDDWNVDGQSASWFTAKKNSEGILVTVTENPSTNIREGSFVIKTNNGTTQQVAVTQKGTNPRLEVVESVFVAWNEEQRVITVKSNMNWSVKMISGGSWCSAAKKSNDELVLNMTKNDLDGTRSAEFLITAGSVSKKVTVTQRVFGYVALYEDYFDNIGGTKKVTKASVSVYALGGYGVRASAFMYRWKVVELDLLNLDMGYSRSFHLSWEPMIRGYLPLQRDKHFWAAYMGLGRRVPLYQGYPMNSSRTVFEMGAEGKMFKRDDISTRFYIRIDGSLSLGVAFDLHDWK